MFVSIVVAHHEPVFKIDVFQTQISLMQMTNDDINRDEEFTDDPEYQAITPAQRNKLLSTMEKMIDMGMAAIRKEYLRNSRQRSRKID